MPSQRQRSTSSKTVNLSRSRPRSESVYLNGLDTHQEGDRSSSGHPASDLLALTAGGYQPRHWSPAGHTEYTLAHQQRAELILGVGSWADHAEEQPRFHQADPTMRQAVENAVRNGQVAGSQQAVAAEAEHYLEQISTEWTQQQMGNRGRPQSPMDRFIDEIPAEIPFRLQAQQPTFDVDRYSRRMGNDKNEHRNIRRS